MSPDPPSPEDPPIGGTPAQDGDASGPQEPIAPRRLDPLKAAQAVQGPRVPASSAVIDTRRYQRRVAYVGFTLLAVASLYLLVTGGAGSPGVLAGGYLHKFVAPLATSNINLPANAAPHCDPQRPTANALNMCDRNAIVLTFFITGDGDCVREVDALARIAPQFPRIEFAALAVSGKLKSTAALVRSHHWRIPVGVDSDGRVGQVYGINICPLVEIAAPGGRVLARLIGNQWSDPRVLAAQVRARLG